MSSVCTLDHVLLYLSGKLTAHLHCDHSYDSLCLHVNSLIENRQCLHTRDHPALSVVFHQLKFAELATPCKIEILQFDGGRGARVSRHLHSFKTLRVLN